jgi:hypothetical protein
MSRFSGPQKRGAAREAKEQRRAEALERQKHNGDVTEAVDEKPAEPAETRRAKRRRVRKGA